MAVGELPQQDPNVDDAYTSPNTFYTPPSRTTSASSTLPAPTAMPAITDVSFAAAFAAPGPDPFAARLMSLSLPNSGT